MLKSLEVVVADCKEVENEFNLNFAKVDCGGTDEFEIASLDCFMAMILWEVWLT